MSQYLSLTLHLHNFLNENLNETKIMKRRTKDTKYRKMKRQNSCWVLSDVEDDMTIYLCIFCNLHEVESFLGLNFVFYGRTFMTMYGK